MNYRDWYVGMKVVCVDAQACGGYGDEHLPQVGSVYTIRELLSDDFSGIPCLRLVEIVNRTREYEHAITGKVVVVEPAFTCRKFRPVQPRKTDISIFTAMLTGAKEREPA